MNLFVTILLSAVAANGPLVEVSTLQGDRHAGRLEQLSAAGVTLDRDGTAVKIPLAGVLDIRFKNSGGQQPLDPKHSEIVLVNGSRFPCTKVGVADGKAALDSPLLGSFSIPQSAVASIRFQEANDEVDEVWNELRSRSLKRDLLVVLKQNNVLDHLDGVIGGLDDRFVRFLLDGSEIPLKREKVFGLIYARRETPIPKSFCEVSFTNSGLARLDAISWDGKQLVGILDGAEVHLPIDTLRRLDFSRGKLRYLSDMEPREVKYTPFFDITWKYWRDRTRNGNPIRLGKTTYRRGLWIHSKTILRYRLGRDYRRFQTVMGIDQETVENSRDGKVHVVISGDGKVLLESDVSWVDKPRVLDVDVSGVLDLEILVDFAGNDIADHLVLADAKVIK